MIRKSKIGSRGPVISILLLLCVSYQVNVHVGSRQNVATQSSCTESSTTRKNVFLCFAFACSAVDSSSRARGLNRLPSGSDRPGRRGTLGSTRGARQVLGESLPLQKSCTPMVGAKQIILVSHGATNLDTSEPAHIFSDWCNPKFA